MLTVYGALMPLRLLEEIRFWKMQEKEHTVVIRELTRHLEPEYVRLLKEWEPVFARSESDAGTWIEAVLRSPAGVTPYMQMQIEGLLHASVEQSQAFISQLLYLLSHSAAVGANPTAQTVIRHIIRESEYFLGVLQSFTSGAAPYRQPPALEETKPSEQQGQPLSRLGQSFASATFFPLKQSLRSQTGVGREPLTRSETPREPADASVTQPEEHTATGEGTWSAAMAHELFPVPVGGHTLPPLPYAYDALEPHIDGETMRLHHDKHHQAYVDGLNKAERMLAEARKTGDYALVKHWEREAAFHGAGHYLHTLFWLSMSPRAGGRPSGAIASQIQKDYGSFDAFRSHFSEAADKVEGGGWALLVWSPRSHRTEILQAEKHQNLSQWDVIPLLALDVWEHAYYLKYRNERSTYIDAWWNVIHWKHVNDRLEAARQLKWMPY
ncbi:Fe-Mn family superoxide dismutase [Gorillibacterium sp. sgz5001074]|uniref:Fe-Mn family superoxide dismutase n=1 Tax=Gorillibacterium sp. sgz5001074 TaxID=3446695 RepID=UPI003F66324E